MRCRSLLDAGQDERKCGLGKAGIFKFSFEGE